MRRGRNFSIAIPEYAEGERPGTTRVLEEHGNDYWLDLIHGHPCIHSGWTLDLRDERHGRRYEPTHR